MQPFTFRATTHPTTPATIGTPISASAMEALIDQPGPIDVETIGADWEADLAGLLNINNPKAVQAGLTKRKEPIQIYAHVVRHPAAGVFLTHLHLDHVSGFPGIPTKVPIYIGPHEAEAAPSNTCGRAREINSERAGACRRRRVMLYIGQASRRLVVVGAFLFDPAMTPGTQKGPTVHTHARSQRHSDRSRHGEAMRSGGESWCRLIELAGANQRIERFGLQPEPTPASATAAVSSPTKHAAGSGGVAERFKAPVSVGTGTREGLEGSFPSSTTEHQPGAPLLNSDRVVQRRRAGRRRHARPASPSPMTLPQHAAVGRWPAGLCRHGAERSAGS